VATTTAVGHARRVSLDRDSLPGQVKRADYLDAFEVTVAESDTRTPEALAREDA